MKILCFLLLFFFQHYSIAQQTISGKIINSETGEGIPYATVRTIENQNIGTISDKNGDFKIQMTSDLDSIYFHVSASGYHFQNIYLQNTIKNQLIKLDERIFELDEIEVVPQKVGEINWYEDSDGLKLYGSTDEDKAFVPMMMKIESTGEFHGNAFKLKKKVKVNEISFHFFKDDGYPDKLYMRIFSTDEKAEFSRNIPISYLNELTIKTILIDDLKNGFNTLDISSENIVASGGYLIIAFTADINDVSKKKFAVYQEKSSGKDILRFSLNSNQFTIFPPFLPKYLIGFNYIDVDEGKVRFKWLRNIFK